MVAVEKYEEGNHRPSTKRCRTIFSPTQLQRLEQEFKSKQYVAGKERGQIAATLNLTDKQVKVWFQNRRIRHRKQKSSQTAYNSTDTENRSKSPLNHVQLN